MVRGAFREERRPPAGMFEARPRWKRRPAFMLSHGLGCAFASRLSSSHRFRRLPSLPRRLRSTSQRRYGAQQCFCLPLTSTPNLETSGRRPLSVPVSSLVFQSTRHKRCRSSSRPNTSLQTRDSSSHDSNRSKRGNSSRSAMIWTTYERMGISGNIQPIPRSTWLRSERLFRTEPSLRRYHST